MTTFHIRIRLRVPDLPVDLFEVRGGRQACGVVGKLIAGGSLDEKKCSGGQNSGLWQSLEVLKSNSLLMFGACKPSSTGAKSGGFVIGELPWLDHPP